MGGVKNIVIKELTRVITDKKLVFSLFILPVIMIVGMYSLMGKLVVNFMDDVEEHVPIVYIQDVPENIKSIISTVEYNGEITYINEGDNQDEIKDKIQEGEVDFLLVFDKEFEGKVKDYKEEGDPIPEIKTYYNPTEEYSYVSRGAFIDEVLAIYEKVMVEERLGNVEQLQVFNIDIDPESSIILDEKKAGGKVLAMILPFLINIMLFAGAMSLCVDAITGEKERGTLSSMLLTPLKRGEIVFGKIISLAILSMISAAIYGVSLIISVPKMMGGLSAGEADSISLSFSFVDMAQILIIMIAMVYLYVAIVSLVSVIAKTSKEANTYVSPIYMIVMVLSMMTMYSGGSKKPLSHFFIPIYNNTIAIQSIFTGDLNMVKFLISTGTTLLFAGIITALITYAFNSEKIMFNA